MASKSQPIIASRGAGPEEEKQRAGVLPKRDEAVRVTFVSSYALDGGAEGQFELLLDGLDKRWIGEVVLLAPGPLEERLRSAGHSVRVMPAFGRLGLLRATVKLRRLVRRARPGAVHADGARAALVAALACLGARVPVVWLKVDTSRDGWLAHLIASRCALVVGISEFVVSSFRERFSERLRVVPCGVPSYTFDREAASRLVRELIGCDPRSPVVIHMSRLYPPKGHLELIEIIPRVLDRHPEVRFLFLPTGVHDPREREYAEHLGIRIEQLQVEHAVAFVYGQKQAVRILSGCNLAVVPSVPDENSGWREGFGMVGGEAMAVGTPVTGYAEAAMPEVLGDCALLVPTGNREALLDAVLRLLEDAPLRERLVACGRERVRRFSVEAKVESMKQCYREAARRAGG
jgi:glycosyltransferase involved in cell wall biosynthesis